MQESSRERAVFVTSYGREFEVVTVEWSGAPRLSRVNADGRRHFRPLSLDVSSRDDEIEIETEDDENHSISFDVPVEAMAEFMRRAGWNVSRREVIGVE